MTQKEQVKQYFENNNNEPKHFKVIANELNILVPNIRRILGQGTLKGEFVRVSKGVYKLNKDVEITINQLENALQIALNKVIEKDNYNYSNK
tara:strand:- start:984 stop:1259 length:276 start_codon:yes stop_codon:yes gene_type:complete